MILKFWIKMIFYSAVAGHYFHSAYAANGEGVGVTNEKECPNISGEYNNISSPSANNKPADYYHITNLDGIISFFARTPDPIKKIIISQQNNFSFQISAAGMNEDVVNRTFIHGNSTEDGNNNFYCNNGAVILREIIKYSGEQGVGTTLLTTELRSSGSALIVHRTAVKELTSLLVFRSRKVIEYWWKFDRL